MQNTKLPNTTLTEGSTLQEKEPVRPCCPLALLSQDLACKTKKPTADSFPKHFTYWNFANLHISVKPRWSWFQYLESPSALFMRFRVPPLSCGSREVRSPHQCPAWSRSNPMPVDTCFPGWPSRQCHPLGNISRALPRRSGHHISESSLWAWHMSTWYFAKRKLIKRVAGCNTTLTLCHHQSNCFQKQTIKRFMRKTLSVIVCTAASKWGSWSGVGEYESTVCI